MPYPKILAFILSEITVLIRLTFISSEQPSLRENLVLRVCLRVMNSFELQQLSVKTSTSTSMATETLKL